MNHVDNCPACASTTTTDIATLNDKRRERFNQFSQRKFSGLLEKWLDEFEPVIRSCNQCGHCWYRYQPSAAQLNEMYSAGVPLGRATTHGREPSPSMILEMKRLRKLVQMGSDTPDLLDYGSGFGRWARAAVIAGFGVTAYEPSADRGAELIVPFELVHDSTGLKGRKFAVVQLEQVLEHVSSPFNTLIDILSLCDPKAILRITVPNILRAPEGKDIWSSWPFDGKSPHIMAPYEHLHGFTPKSLDALLKRVGLVSMCSIKYLSLYPLNGSRMVLNRVFPSLGSTLRVAQISGHACQS